MKKLLTILGTLVLTSSSAFSVTARQNQPSTVKPPDDPDHEYGQDVPTPATDPYSSGKK